LRLDVEFTRRPVTSRFKPVRSFQPRSVSFRGAHCPRRRAQRRRRWSGKIELPLPAVELELAHQLPLAG
jgi:hypothetical protein